MKRECSKRPSGGGGGGAGGRSAPFTCGHCGRSSHLKDWCFDLHPELRSDRPQVRPPGGRGGAGPVEGRRATTAAPVPTNTATMAATIEELEQRIASMAVARPRSASEQVLPRAMEEDQMTIPSWLALHTWRLQLR
ncbi:unnamed protein product [Calypogeia fissa]